MLKPTYPISKIKDITLLPNKGPWPTKSNGQLNVLFNIDLSTLNKKFLNYESSELDKIKLDIRGLRSYRVEGLRNGSIGANEFHRIRNELMFVVSGSVKWTCEDVYGDIKEFIINQFTGLWVPPFILHTYEALEDDTELLVIANTLFFPDDPTTHDSFGRAAFKKLQKQNKA